MKCKPHFERGVVGLNSEDYFGMLSKFIFVNIVLLPIFTTTTLANHHLWLPIEPPPFLHFLPFKKGNIEIMQKSSIDC